MKGRDMAGKVVFDGKVIGWVAPQWEGRYFVGRSNILYQVASDTNHLGDCGQTFEEAKQRVIQHYLNQTPGQNRRVADLDQEVI